MGKVGCYKLEPTSFCWTYFLTLTLLICIGSALCWCIFQVLLTCSSSYRCSPCLFCLSHYNFSCAGLWTCHAGHQAVLLIPRAWRCQCSSSAGTPCCHTGSGCLRESHPFCAGEKASQPTSAIDIEMYVSTLEHNVPASFESTKCLFYNIACTAQVDIKGLLLSW